MAQKRTFRIALAQLRVRDDDMQANANGILDAIVRAADEKADFLLTPESALTGHHDRFDKPLRDKLMARIRAAVKAAGVTTIVGGCDKRRGRSTIEQVIVGRDGRILGRQAKIVLASIDRSWATPGRRAEVLRDRGLSFGCLVCNDLWVVPLSGARDDPRLTLRLARRGARVVFVSVNSGSDQRFRAMHESNLFLRAMEGRLVIAVANAVADGAVNATSGIVGPDGNWITRCNRRSPQFAVTDVTLQTQAELRKQEEPGFLYVRHLP